MYCKFGLAFNYIGKACFLDLIGFFDGAAYVFVLLAMVPSRLLLIFIFAFLASFVDERAILACILVIFWWQVRSGNNADFSAKKFIIPARESIVVFSALITHFVVRYILFLRFGMYIPTGENDKVGLAVFRENFLLFPLGLFSHIEFYWIFILLSLLILFSLKKYFLSIVFLMAVICICLSSLMVYDITRSGGYILPLIFTSLFIIRKTESLYNIRLITLIVAVCCFLLPSIYVEGPDQATWISPIIPKIYKWFAPGEIN